jgi:glucosamine-6-phosphate deaminase
VAAAIAEKPALVLGLPTGRTPLPLYRELVTLHQKGKADFSRVTTFNLDEFVGLSAGNPRSYRSFMRRHLFDAVNLPPRRTHVPNGAAPDLERESRRYDRAVAQAGGIDLLLLGLGANGHIGFNEPADALNAHTHVTTLTPATRQANRALFGRLDHVPRQAISMGMATILHSRRIVLLATGAAKARCVARTVRGPLTPRLPASFLQLHPRCEVWLDRAAASLLDVE